MIRTRAQLTDLQIPTWFFPSFHGDIRLTSTGEDSCDLVMTKLTPMEEKAIVQLSATAIKKGWFPGDKTLTPTSGTASLRAPIDKVARLLQKLLKPEKTTITAVLFADGAMAEVRGPMDLPDAIAPASSVETAQDVEVLPKATATERKKRKAVAAATVAAPVRGCPAPDFTQADLRAKDVLRTFLTSDQVADFNRYNKFVSVGQTTGNHYMITSRHARDELSKYTRTLYDLDRMEPLCVHDWDVPAAEEMLTLHLLLQLPGWERYLRVTEDNLEGVLREFMSDDHVMPVLHGPFEHDERLGHFTVSPAVIEAARRGLI